MVVLIQNALAVLKGCIFIIILVTENVRMEHIRMLFLKFVKVALSVVPYVRVKLFVLVAIADIITIPLINLAIKIAHQILISKIKIVLIAANHLTM